ncbi:MAG: ERF family protein [Thermodesulfobacteriota bacterium]|nr:ERF family protein [Thermodesulfobacteriota bacterium]
MYKKLAKVQKDLKAPKSQYNKFGRYNYRNLEDIMEAVKPLLYKNELTLTMSDEPVLIGDRFYIKATATLSEFEHTENKIIAVAYARETLIQKGMNEAQITGSTSSYARKYCLNGLFCIDDTKDADFTNTGQNNTQNAPQQNLMTKAQVQKITNLTKELQPDAGNKEIGKVAALLGVSSKTTTARQFDSIWEQAQKNQFQAVVAGLEAK